MYPFKVALVGCDAEVLATVRRELTVQSIEVQDIVQDLKALLASRPTPQAEKLLFIVQINTPYELAEVERVNDVFPGWPILVLLDIRKRSALLLNTMRAGAAQIVLLPMTPEDFRLALDRIARQFGYPTDHARLVAVCGAQEGCGVTALTINL